ncbi:MAG: peptidylprolyl isomerase [Calditrichaceae bacterium]
MFKQILLSSLLIIINSCNQFTSKNEYFKQIKQLEYNRVSDPEEWSKIKNSDEFNALKYTFVNSIGKTRLDTLTSLVHDVLKASKEDSLTGECIFALGQIGSQAAEQIIIDLPFEKLSLKNKKKLLSALCHCASEKTIEFYLNHINDLALKSDILINAALCSRQNLDVSEIKSSVVDSIALLKPTLALSYFLYYAGDRSDLGKLLQLTINSRGLAHKYALKKLNTLLLKNEKRFYSKLDDDSTSFDALKKILNHSLKQTASWQIQYYAIPIAASLKDSVLTERISALIKSSNNYVNLIALEYLADADEDLAISAIVEQFGKEKNLYKKGQIIKILAKYYPEKAYSFVMQNLDKGDSKFKAQLLDALASIKSKMALRILKQFINVDDPILICSAFDNLKRIGILNKSDITTLLNSDHFSCVALALEYCIEKNKTLDSELLLKIYKKFNRISQFEVQLQVINYIKKNSPPSSIHPDSLMQYASHDVIRKQVFKSFKKSFSKSWKNWSSGFNHASVLVPDSISYYSSNPIIEIETERGNIEIELYSSVAPYTVYSILRLIQNNFYDGLTFHRVVPDFVIQGGDPTGSGWGGPDYLIPSEDNYNSFIQGSVGIATSGFDTGSSQFFICQSEQPHLNGNYTLFGQVTKGMDVVNSILPEDKILTVKIIE